MKFLKNKRRRLTAVIAVTLVALTACSQNSEEVDRASDNARDEQRQVQTGFSRLADSQQIPLFDWSQERQTLIDVETIRATGATSTTAFYLEGIGLIAWCPSIGAPVPSTYQLSTSQQYIDLEGDGTEQFFPIDQGEPTGVYVGESSGTWTLCLDDNGNKFAKYWEGYVDSTVGIVSSYRPELRVIVDDLTFEFTEAPG